MAMFTFNPSGQLSDLTETIFDLDKYSDLDPTFVSRYLVQASILKAYKASNKIEKLRILDVGGAGSLIKEFIDVNLYIIDPKPNDNNDKNYTVGNALNMPFSDNEFDAVITCDVLEHIKKEDRGQFIKECCRVSKELVVIAAPFNLTGVRLAEISANNFYKKLTGENHVWLQEHLQDELPELYQTKKQLAELDMSNGHFSHTSLDYWQLLTRISFFMGLKTKEPILANDIKSINSFYLDKIMTKDFSVTGYRSFIVANKKDRVSIKKENDRYEPELENVFALLSETILDLI